MATTDNFFHWTHRNNSSQRHVDFPRNTEKTTSKTSNKKIEKLEESSLSSGFDLKQTEGKKRKRNDDEQPSSIESSGREEAQPKLDADGNGCTSKEEEANGDIYDTTITPDTASKRRLIDQRTYLDLSKKVNASQPTNFDFESRMDEHVWLSQFLFELKQFKEKCCKSYETWHTWQCERHRLIIEGVRSGIPHRRLDELEAKGMFLLGCCHADVNRWESSEGNECMFQGMKVHVAETV
eukprot:CAMPEP_0116007426 /NCGR_PEP_ID=MMETSP0321-20121206/2292_1 /TAXON_ID=163516 /ORGANISM="Leptocylindrus danicus var. danicus, Strain B650" /LENGTH=237 /DNA_ID=CAMNT_0003476119 /DNA_START=9 /DNA_END=722 /DNA_ORIENTATION=+